jgi:phenylalanyl-tRNA synthetase alpha chain
MTTELEALRNQAEPSSESRNGGDLQTVRTRYLGRKGLLTALLRNIGNFPPEEKPQFGKRCNEIKEELSARIDQALAGLASSKRDEVLLRERIDVTLRAGNTAWPVIR